MSERFLPSALDRAGGRPSADAVYQRAAQPVNRRARQPSVAGELRGRAEGEPGVCLDAQNPEARSSSGGDQPRAQTGPGPRQGSSGQRELCSPVPVLPPRPPTTDMETELFERLPGIRERLERFIAQQVARHSSSLANGGRKRRRNSPTSLSSRRVALKDEESFSRIQQPSTSQDSASGSRSSTKALARKAAGPSQGAEEEEEMAAESEDSESSQSSLSDDEEEPAQESCVRCLFQKKYLSLLIVRAMKVLALSDTLEKDPQTGVPKRPSEVDKVLLRCKRSYLQFAFPVFFEKQLKEEWSVPLAHRLNIVHAKKLYPFPNTALEFLKVPLVDAPVIGIVLGHLIPMDRQGSLKGATGRNSELALFRTHEALALAVRASVATSLVARASVLWARLLLTESSTGSKKQKDCLQMLEQASAFIADGSLDTVRFSARAMASVVVARRHLWLRSCAIDSLSKTNLATSSFVGEKVFGDDLHDFLKEMEVGRCGSEEEETASESEGSEFLSDEEKEELLDEEEEEEEPMQEPHTYRLFIQKDLSPLIVKAMRVLELSDTLEEDRQARTAKGNWRYESLLTIRKRSYPKFAFPQFFEEEIKKAWAIPLAHKVSTRHTQKLYPFPRQMLNLIKVPIVDAPVTALVSGAAFPRDGDISLKREAERDSELALCRAHEALALSVRTSVATSLAARASMLWASQLLAESSAGSQKFKEYLKMIEKASAFMADGSLDSMRFSARAMASAVVARRHLWLKNWKVDSLSKTIAATYAFLGGKLFGDTINKILVETQGKVKVLPCNARRQDRPYRFQASHSQRVQGHFRKSRWSRPRPSSKPQYRYQSFRQFSGDNSRGRFHNRRY